MHYLDLIFVKAWAEIKSEASRAYIGFLWWFIEPILYMGAFYLLFGLGLRYGGDNFLYFLLCGLLPWKWFASTVANGSQALAANAGMINQVYLPKYVLPLTTVVVNTSKFVIVMPLLLLALALSGFEPSAAWWGLIVLIACQFLLVASVTCLLSAIVPFIPDLRYVIENGMLLLMFLSGVFFNVADFEGLLGTLLMLNPMAVLLQGYRTVLIEGQWPAAGDMMFVMAWVLMTGLIGFYLLKLVDRRVIKVV